MRTRFFTYAATSEITGSGVCQTEFLDQQGLNGDTAIAGEADPEKHYYLNGEVCSYTDEELAVKKSLPTGWAWKMPERIAVDMRDMDAVRRQAWERIKKARKAAELAPFTHAGSMYDANKEQIGGAAQMALLAQLSEQPFSIDWTLRDNSTKTHSAAEMIAVGVALGKHVSDIYDAGRVLREQITAATTPAELDAIQWPIA